MTAIAGLFDTRGQAEQAFRELSDAGIRADDIGLVARDVGDPNAEDMAEGRSEGAGVGAIGGGVLGTLAGLVVGAGTFVVPGLGTAVAAGALASAVAGGAFGAAAGGLLGALIDAGLSEEDARHYQAGIERGAVLLTVRVSDAQAAEVRRIFDRNGVRDRDFHRALWEQNPDHRDDLPRPTALDTRPGAQWKDAEHEGAILAGGATGAVLGTAVGTLTGGPVGAAVGMALGAVAGGAAGAAIDYRDVEPHFRDEWEHGSHRDRFDWDEATAAYRYGWESFSAPEFQGRAWHEARPELQRHWTGGPNWGDAEPLVRTAWDRRAREAP